MQMIKKYMKLELESLINLAGVKPPVRVESIEDGLQFLRSCVLYLIFDAEATRRELKEAQKRE